MLFRLLWLPDLWVSGLTNFFQDGAQTVLYLCLSESVESISGAYFGFVLFFLYFLVFFFGYPCWVARVKRRLNHSCLQALQLQVVKFVTCILASLPTSLRLQSVGILRCDLQTATEVGFYTGTCLIVLQNMSNHESTNGIISFANLFVVCFLLQLCFKEM